MAVSSVKATINGTSYTLTYNSSTGCYEGTITAPSKSSFSQSGGYYGIEITAYDDFGNSKTINSSDSTYGSKLKLTVKETVKPTITSVYPTNNAVLTNNKPTISWKCADEDSGIKESSIKLTIDGTVASGTITKTKGSDGTYTCSYTLSSAFTDGSHTLKFECADNDGNTQTSTVTIKVDTVPPTLNVSSPAKDMNTNQGTLTVSGYTNDATSSPVTVTINGTAVTVNSSGYFSKDIALSLGTNTINVVATDSSGQKTTVTRTIKYNNIAPTFESVSVSPNPVIVGNTFVISVKVTDS